MLCINVAKVTNHHQFSYLPSFLFDTEIQPKVLLGCERYPRVEINASYQILRNDKLLSNCGSFYGLLFQRDPLGLSHSFQMKVRREPRCIYVKHAIHSLALAATTSFLLRCHHWCLLGSWLYGLCFPPETRSTLATCRGWWEDLLSPIVKKNNLWCIIGIEKD